MRSQHSAGKFPIRQGAMNRFLTSLVVVVLTLVGWAAAALIGTSTASAQDYGPDTCLQGYVWREAFPGDHVCVTPATRSQAAYDNSQADSRRAAVKIWLTRWSPVPNCDGNVCASTDEIPHFKVNGDHFNINGQVWIGFYHLNDHRLITSYKLAATVHAGFSGGSFGKNADVIDCSFDKKTPVNTYVQAYDYASGRWSNSITIRTGCAVL
jgi:hypothetical protein